MINLRSGFVRLAILMTLLPALIIAILGAFTVQKVEAQLNAEIRNQVNDDIANLVEIYTQSNVAGLQDAIIARLAMVPSNRALSYYHLQDTQNKTIGGNYVSSSPQNRSQLYMRETTLRGGERLSAGRSYDSKNKTVRGLKTLFIQGVIISLLLGMITGIFSALNFHKRLKQINDVCADVARGNLVVRVKKGKLQDEVTDLSKNVNDMLDRVQKLITLRKNISDQVAHELRTPLTHLDNSLRSASKASQTPEVIESAREEVRTCVALLDGLLDVSALEAQQGDKQDFENINLSELTQNICDFYEALAEEKAQKLVSNLSDDCNMQGDPLQINRVIANLLDNAIKYTPEHGIITVTTQNENGAAVLKIKDTGPGISPSLRDDVFIPFFRMPQKQNTNGHGLGLALVKAIIDRHEGKISVSKPVEKTGAEFTISFKRN